MIKNKKGFTLIEILVVVAIIAILASVVLIGLGPTRKAGRDARRISDLRQVQSGLELYFNKCGYYPGGTYAAGTPCNAIQTQNNTWAAMSASLTGSGLGVSAVPVDPGSTAYQYSTAVGGGSYTIAATLEDGTNPAMKSSVQGISNGINGCGAITNGAGLYCVTL